MKNLIIVAGHAGTGKTSFSKQVSQRLGLPLLDKDTLTQPLVQALAERLTGDPYDRHSRTYLEKIRPLEYQVLDDTMWEVLEHGGHGAVVTAPFIAELSDPDWIGRLRSRCAAEDCRLTVVWMSCDERTLRRRILDRGETRDLWKILNWHTWVQSLQTPPLQETGTVVNNSSDPASLQQAADSLAALLASP